MHKEIIERLDRIEAKLGEVERPLTLPEAAGYLDLSKSFVYKLTSSGRLTHFKTGKRIYFRRADLNSYLLKNRVKPVDEIEMEAANRVAFGR